MAKIRVDIVSQGLSISDRVSRLIRCSGCEYLHENGNCLAQDSFFSSVADKE